MSLACVAANCCSRERKTESWVSRAEACEERKAEPCVAYCAEVRRERSKAARPTALFLRWDIFVWGGAGKCVMGGWEL